MRLRRRLFSSKDPYAFKTTRGIFVDAMAENCACHYVKNAKYKKILDNYGFSPSDLKLPEDLENLPFIPTAVFKRHDLNTITPGTPFTLTATSSGTGGKMSRITFDIPTLWNALVMAIKVGKHRKLFSLKPCNYIIFGYKPHKSNKTAVTKTALATTWYAPALRRVFALKFNGTSYEPDLDGMVKAIEKFSHSRFPTRFMGFPSYTYFVMKMLDEKGMVCKLPAGSKILLGGGWKQFYKEKVEKDTFYALAEKVLGVNDTDIVEFFGAVEHPVLYADCVKHRFHIPVYSQVMIRDPKDFSDMGYGRTGLINLMTPLAGSSPILSVMTDDLGILHDTPCECGIDSPWLEVIGRVGLKDIKTCAAGAEELLKGGKDK